MKRIMIVTILLAVLSSGMTGCMQKEPRRQKSSEAALEYMEQKYGEEFEFVQPWGNSMSGNHELIVTCESLAGERILVKISNYKDEDRVFQDNYLAVKYHEETVDFLSQCANEVFGDSKVYYDVAKIALSADLSADASFEEYFADEEGQISAYIAVRASSFTAEEQAEKVTDPILSACGAWYVGILLVVVEDAEYESLDEDILAGKIGRRQFVHCARVTRERGNVRFEWLEKK